MFDKIEGLDDVIKFKHGLLDISYDREDHKDLRVEVFYKETRLASRPNLIDALEYAYIGVRLCNPHFADWCYGDERGLVVMHIQDALSMVGKPTPRAIEDQRLKTGIYRTIQLRTEDGMLHPKEDDIRITIHRATRADFGIADHIETTITMTDHDITISKKIGESATGEMRDLQAWARKLYVRHFE